MQTTLHFSRNSPAWAANAQDRQPLLVAAALMLFVGLSAANAIGGPLQLAYVCISLGAAVLHRHKAPLSLMIGVIACGTISTISSFSFDPSLSPLLSFIRPFLEGYVLAIVLFYYLKIKTLNALLTALAGYVLIELLSAMAMASLPDLRSALLAHWYNDESYDGQAFQTALLIRGFGVSRHHLYGFPLALGVICVMLLVGASLEKLAFRRFILTTAAAGCALLILPNARIGLLPILTCYFLGLSFYFRTLYLRHMLILVFIGVPVLIFLVRMYLGDTAELLLNWLGKGLTQFTDSTNSDDSTTLSDLSAMIILPTEPLTWLIGEGRICQPGEDCYSDIGWIRLLQQGGLLLAFTVAIVYLTVIRQIHAGLRNIGMDRSVLKVSSSHNLIFWVLLITFILATVKGEAYATNDYSRLLMMLAVLMQQLPKTRYRCLSH